MDWQLLWMALGLALILEGLPYFLFPDRAARILRQVDELGPTTLRVMGLLGMMTGVVLLIVGRTLFQ